MIYEFAAASIKHNFPRAVLMTWRERHFITGTAPGMDAERAKGYCPLKQRPLFQSGFVWGLGEMKVFWIIETHKGSGEKRLGGQDMKRLWVIWYVAYRLPELSDKCKRWNWEPNGRSLEAKLVRLHNSRRKAEQLADDRRGRSLKPCHIMVMQQSRNQGRVLVLSVIFGKRIDFRSDYRIFRCQMQHLSRTSTLKIPHFANDANVFWQLQRMCLQPESVC